jgi:hypothetical protein
MLIFACSIIAKAGKKDIIDRAGKFGLPTTTSKTTRYNSNIVEGGVKQNKPIKKHCCAIAAAAICLLPQQYFI